MAFTSKVVWEVRTTGSDTNGGGFDPTSGTPGTDFSQQTSPQITYTDMVIGATTTQFTSVANSPDASLVGNIINITSGTGFNVQRVQVISVAAGVATCDKSLGTTASSGGNGEMGGCLATPATAATLVVAGNTTYIKATAAYTSASTTFSASGSAGLPISWIGYTTTRTDGGQCTLISSAGTITCITSGGFQRFVNIIANANAQGVSAWHIANNNDLCFFNCKGVGATNGFNVAVNRVSLINSLAITCSVAGFNFNTVVGSFASGCRATGNTANGFAITSSTVSLINCISDNNTGASTDGFNYSSASQGNLIGCVGYTNGRDGIRIASGSLDDINLRNCIFVSNTGNGINALTTNWAGFSNLLTQNIDYNAYYNNAANLVNVPAGIHDQLLTGDPFTNGSSNDFSLNNTAGAGAACRSAGFPGVLQSGGTGYEDIGALRHADPAGSAGMLFVPNLEGT